MTLVQDGTAFFFAMALDPYAGQGFMISCGSHIQVLFFRATLTTCVLRLLNF